MVRKFIIADHALESFSGHYYEYDKALASELIKRGINVSIYANERVTEPIQQDIQAIPYFPAHYSLFSFWTIKYLSFWRKFKTLLAGLDQGTTVFIPQLYAGVMIPFIMAVLSVRIRHGSLVVFYRYSNQNWKGLDLIYRFCFTLLQVTNRMKAIHFVTDSNLLQNELLASYKVDSTLIPIPHTSTQNIQTHADSSAQALRMYSPGPARTAKGLQLIVEAIEHLHNTATDTLSKKYVFIIQHDPRIDSSSDTLELIKRLSSLSKHPKIDVQILGSLSPVAYRQELQAADIIFLPYLANNGDYKVQTSGVFTEVVAIGKPVVVSDNTWMAHEFRRNDLAGAIMPTYSANGLLEAIQDVARNLTDYTRKADVRRESWNDFHNPAKVCDILLSLSNTVEINHA